MRVARYDTMWPWDFLAILNSNTRWVFLCVKWTCRRCLMEALWEGSLSGVVWHSSFATRTSAVEAFFPALTVSCQHMPMWRPFFPFFFFFNGAKLEVLDFGCNVTANNNKITSKQQRPWPQFGFKCEKSFFI